MKLLIVLASRHGGTRGIAEALADELKRDGHVVELSTPAEAPPIEAYDAVVVGSAVYIGKWLKDARNYLKQHQQELRRVPVWLFSSGPTGETAPQAKADPPDIAQLIEEVQARGHRTFLGKLDPTQLGLSERFIIWNVKRMAPDAVQDGDFRDWAAIREWADEISAALRVGAVV